MGCFSQEIQASVGLKPSKDRSCTDILFLLLFIAFWGGTIYVAQKAIASGGDPNRVIRGVDLYGRVCGKDSGVEDMPYAAWPYPPEYTAQVCLSSCTETSSDARIAVPHSSARLVWFCIPDVATRDPSFEAVTQKFNWALGDLYTAWPVILGSVAVALAFSFLYVLFCRRFAGALVWTVIFGLMAGGFMLAGALLRSAYTSDSTVDAERVKAMYGLGGVVLALTAFFAILVFGLRKRIAIAVEVVREASRALSAMLTLPFFPVLPMLYTVAYFAFWIIVALYLYSVASKAEKPTPSGVTAGLNNPNPTTQVYYERDTAFNNIIIGHFFGLLWNVQFVIYFAYLVMAGAVADWYFHPRDGSVELQPRSKVAPVAGEAWAESGQPASPVAKSPAAPAAVVGPRSSTPVWDSVKRATRYHLGTVAFGSLIIAIINFIRAVVTYIEAKTRNRNNRLQKILFCMLQCFLSCLHCCADKISKNAFIWTAIWGDSFVPAACSSFKLLWQNLARVAAINLVGAYLLFLGKVIVATCTAGVAALVLSQVTRFKEELSSILLPCFAVFLLAFAVASLFLNVYETTIDTIFLCFLVDAEYNKSAEMFASKELQDLVGKHAAESKKLAEEAVALPEQ